MDVLISTEGQTGLPRYFASVFEVSKALKHGRLDFVMPDGRRFRVEGPNPGPVGEIEVMDADIFARLIREGDMGFCDAYLEGDWSTPDLLALMDLLHRDNDAVYNAFPGMVLLRAFERMHHLLRPNSKAGSRKNIAHHYDLGNNFYKLWLDDTMTYSSALYTSGQESLEKAQTQKYASMVDQMGVESGDHVLEIGCGWGGFAEYAARERGLRVTGLTISQAQHDYAVERMKCAGLEHMVKIKLQDYRDETGVYDGIASIEMFEAVGEKYWPTYFNTVLNRLRPGKNATLQIITIREERFDSYRKSVDFIQKYIFPGGMLPSPTVLRREVEKAGLKVLGSIEFGKSYSRTLRHWHEAFNARWADVARQGFDDRFRRMWNFYLTSCAGAFESGNCDVTQITITRPN